MWDLRALPSSLLRAKKPPSQAVHKMRGFLRPVADTGLTGLRRIHPPERVAQEVELALRHFTDARLLLVHRQLQLAHDLPQSLQGFFAFASSAQDHESSSGGGSHPSALTEPDVKLSPHPAPTLRPPVARRAATGQTGWGPAARCVPASASTRVLDV